jgi:uncharacterized membrane protein
MNKLTIRNAAAGLLAIVFVVSILVAIAGGTSTFHLGAIVSLLFAILIVDTLRITYGWKDALFVCVVSYVILTLVLIFGFYYGWPFGAFRYADAIGYQLNSFVPWTVPVIWIALIAAILPLTRRVKKGSKSPSMLFAWAFDTSVIVTVMDAVIEPVLSATGLKEFLTDQGVYGVPPQHLIGFFITTFLISCIIIARVFRHRGRSAATQPLTWSVVLFLLFFTVLAGTLHLPIAAIIGILAAAWIVWRLRGIKRA